MAVMVLPSRKAFQAKIAPVPWVTGRDCETLPPARASSHVLPISPADRWRLPLNGPSGPPILGRAEGDRVAVSHIGGRSLSPFLEEFLDFRGHNAHSRR